MGQPREAGSTRGREARASECGLDPVLLTALLAAAVERKRRERERLEPPGAELELAQRRLRLREQQTNLVMGVVVRLFAMAYLVAILVLYPLLLAPTGLAAAAYLWRR